MSASLILLISACIYLAIGVAVGAPVLTLLTRHWPRKRLLLVAMLFAAVVPDFASH